MAHKKGGLNFGYCDHYAVDGGKARIILEVLVTPADVMENLPFLEMLCRGAADRNWPEPETAAPEARLGAPAMAERGSGGISGAPILAAADQMVAIIRLTIARKRFGMVGRRGLLTLGLHFSTG